MRTITVTKTYIIQLSERMEDQIEAEGGSDDFEQIAEILDIDMDYYEKDVEVVWS